jgi:spore coat-associated protein N
MNIKKQLLGAAMATAIGAAAIGGGTYALFTDTAANTGNTFTAGTVVIDDVTNGSAFTATSFVGNMAPGDSESGTIKIKNNGSLDAFVKIKDVTTSGALFGGTTPVIVDYDNDGVVMIPANTESTFNVTYSFPLAAGNSYQGATGSVDFNVQAVQVRNNYNDTNSSGSYDAGDTVKSWNEDAS